VWAWQSGLSGEKRITESPRLDFETIFHTLDVFLFRLGEDAFVIGFSNDRMAQISRAGRKDVRNKSTECRYCSY
jgi:hypothetical protein